MKIRDRIKEFRRVKASDLAPSPKNWRTHPKAQKEALQGLLAEIGFAGAVLARETPNGLMLIDGHLRTETAADSEIPVLILDVDEAEADKILATFDPIGAMADSNAAALDALLRGVETSSEAVAGMLTKLAQDAGILDGATEKYTRKIEAPIYEPKNRKPTVAEIVDQKKTLELIQEIDDAKEMDEDCRAFLRMAAQRHLVFNYELAADYYANSGPQVQDLMERSALVIIDFNKAIEYGYTRIGAEIAALYGDEHGKPG